MKIALDILGGDNSPIANIKGAINYLEGNFASSVEIILVGDQHKIQSFLKEFKYNNKTYFN